jgi:hypothetical protein
LSQRAPEAVQVPPSPASLAPQHAWPTAPQATVPFWHDPFVQVPAVPPPMQVIPAATHFPPAQQPPPSQVFAAQQA